jgi:tRNA threonylcarbamoyladenosine biosynthesis protein TsaE
VSARPARTASAALRHASAGPDETERLGETLAPLLRVADVLTLEGPLGAGKTRFVTGLARGLEARARVRSPSFTLVNEYDGRVPLLHLDLYRLTAADEHGLGLEELCERGVLAVEWGERLPAHLLQGALRIEFEITGEQDRSITASADRGRGRELLDAWRAAGEGR